MAINIAGILKDGIGEPIPNCTIELKTKRTTQNVIIKTEANLLIDKNGSYSMDVEPGEYDVTLFVEGFSPKCVGSITVYSDSPSGTLNDFLISPGESELSPQQVLVFQQLRDEAKQAAAEAKQTYDLAANMLSNIPKASTSTAGIVKLSDSITSDSSTDSATSKAVKQANDLADSKVSTINGKSGNAITLSAVDVDAVSATTGGTFAQPITGTYIGSNAYADQYNTKSAFYQSVQRPAGGSEYHPIIKQRTVLPSVNAYAFSMGVLVGGTDLSWLLHMIGSGGQQVNHKWDVKGNYNAPKSITAGQDIIASGGWVYAGNSYMNSSGDINGSAFGGTLSSWVRKNFIQGIRRGSQQYTRPPDGTANYEIPDGYITGFNNSTNDGNLRFCGWYFRVPMYLVNGTWVNAESN
ncbi:prophage tail fiber N-terminal domain-containing protein [Limnobaculum parvum]|uniref:Lambda-like tail fibre protein N-terminal domain-containing protein n=1 Tax=Limnobaculum parvum TaxID=2172103 RepID=A0A2Y9TWA8_9GAMM|nr:prophage tail fiber N-terminal domain-containing protein [Limnobaculum parvum]AWH88028.1 hypothetical protein HYN51_05310 [Limnobaculum parvum]